MSCDPHDRNQCAPNIPQPFHDAVSPELLSATKIMTEFQNENPSEDPLQGILSRTADHIKNLHAEYAALKEENHRLEGDRQKLLKQWQHFKLRADCNSMTSYRYGNVSGNFCPVPAPTYVPADGE